MPHLDRSGQLLWTTRLTRVVVAVALVLGAAAALIGGETGQVVGTIAVVVIIVALGGRWMTARSERWARTDRPITRVRIRNGRAVIWRWDAAALIMVPLLAVAVALPLVELVDSDATKFGSVVFMALAGSMLIMTSLLAVSGRVVVTAHTVRVHRLVTRHTIPRHVVRGLRRTGEGGVAFLLADGTEVRAPTGVHGIWIRGPWNYDPAELKAEHRIRTALDTIPEGPPAAGAVTVSRRHVLVGLWALSTLTYFGIIVALLLLGWLS